MEFIKAPKDFPNDETLTIVEYLLPSSAVINEEDECLSVEGSKAIFSVSAPASGFIHWLVDIGDVVPVGEVIGIIYQADEKALLEAHIQQLEQEKKAQQTVPDNFTVPAFKLVKELGLAIADFKEFELVTSKEVQQVKDKQFLIKLEKHAQQLLPEQGNGRTLLVGAGKAASQILSVLHTDKKTQVVGFVDDTPEKQGTSHHGYPILGTTQELQAVLKTEQIDAIICSAGHMDLRIKTIELALEHKLKLANAVHPSVVMDEDVTIGGGNYIGPLSFIGAQASIGFGCFISSGAIFEHHNRIGHCVTTGPANACSGTVSIGNFCVFGSGIIVEPMLNIGDYCAIASGCVISKAVAAHSVLKTSVNYVQR